MKRKSPTLCLLFSSPLLLRPLPDISLATWDLDLLSHHQKTLHVADEDLYIPELSPQNKRIRRKKDFCAKI